MSAADSPMQLAGPSTPPASSLRITQDHLDEDYFNGVPGAPARKLRSQPKHISERLLDERRLKARGVAKLLTFNEEGSSTRRNEINRKCLATQKHRRDRGDDDDDDWATEIKERDTPRLLSPFSIEEAKKPISSTISDSHSLKRSFSTSACTDLLVDAAMDRRSKRYRPERSQLPGVSLATTRSSTFAKLHDIRMRRAESASSDYQMVVSEACDKSEGPSWISDAGVTTNPLYLQILGNFIPT